MSEHSRSSEWFRNTLRVLACACLLMAASPGPVSADMNIWQPGGTNDWYGDTNNWSLKHFPEAGEDVVIGVAGAGVVLTSSAPASGWLKSFDISGTATLIFSNWSTTLSATNVTVEPNAALTCAGLFTNPAFASRVSIVCSDLTVQASGRIDVEGKGYWANVAYQNAYGPGAGAGYVGGGYGGRGGRPSGVNSTGRAYGNYQAPEEPGSAGGNGANRLGGDGGGAVRVDAQGTVTVNGTITAKGGRRACSGGSGGAIYITCNTIAGANGTMLADGADGGSETLYGGSGGGGGRISVVFNPAAQSNAPVPTIRFSCAGMVGPYGTGDLGTIYFPAPLLLLSETISTNNLTGQICGLTSWAPDHLTVDNGWIGFPQEGFVLNITNQLLVSGSYARLELCANNSTYTNGPYRTCETNGPTLNVGGDLVLTNGGSLLVFAGMTNATYSNYTAWVSVTNGVRIGPNSWLYPYSHSTNGGSVYFRMNSLTVCSGGGINADGLGFSAGYDPYGTPYGPGAGSGTIGAGHGGVGGCLTYMIGRTYGSERAPNLPGSAGGGGSGRIGGEGGGLVRIDATGAVTVDGTISANAIRRGSGGGSGGGIYITCDTIRGTGGFVRADGSEGGSETQYGGGGGGGGRIAVFWNPSSQTSAPTPQIGFSALGRFGYRGTGDVGTLYFTDPKLFLNETMTSNSLAGQIRNLSSWSVNSLTISNTWIKFTDNGVQITVSNDLSITGTNGRFGVGGNRWWLNGPYILTETNGPEVRVGGNLTLADGAILDVFGGITNSGTPDYGALFSVVGDMNLASGCCVYVYSHGTNGGSPLFLMRNLTIPAGALFNADYRGFSCSNAYSGLGYGPGGANGQKGGGYGGAGGTGWPGAGSGGGTYGASNGPVHAGSGGGSSTGRAGGPGGGLVRITSSGRLTLNGTITARGCPPFGYDVAGGGSGGGIYVVCVALRGNGLLDASGAAGGVSNVNYGAGGGGGGGRIAVWRVRGDECTAAAGGGLGGTGAVDGAAGTIFWGWLPESGTVFVVR